MRMAHSVLVKRLALTRCLYSGAQILLLDDVLGACDNKVEDLVWHKLFGKEGLLLNKTVVMITNSVKRFQHANNIIFLSDGKQIEEGTSQAIAARSAPFRDYLATAMEPATIRELRNRMEERYQSVEDNRTSAKETDKSSDSVQPDEVDLESEEAGKPLIYKASIEYIRDCTVKYFILAVILNLPGKPTASQQMVCLLMSLSANAIHFGPVYIYYQKWTNNSSNEKDADAAYWLAGLIALSAVQLGTVAIFWHLRYNILCAKVCRKFMDRATISRT